MAKPQNHLLAALFGVISTLLTSMPGTTQAEDLALTVFAGQVTGVSAWHNIITHPDELDCQDAYLVAGALAYTLDWFLDGALALELEGQVVQHLGEQSHWELNLPIVVRWHEFPWNDRVSTSAAFGIGPSYATVVPPLEIELEGESQRFLYHWFMELTLGPPNADWTTSSRIHHRSGGFGSVADEGGSNALTLGIKFDL
jgi:hypothetical protein